MAVFGPRRSLNLSALPAAQGMLVGDETALGLAAAWQPACTILEVDQAEALQPVLGRLGIHATLQPRLADEHHLAHLANAALAQGTDRRFVLVAHAGTNAAALGHLLGVRPVPWEWERFVSFHASVTVLSPLEIAGGWAFSLLRFSDTAHLGPAEQSR